MSDYQIPGICEPDVAVTHKFERKIYKLALDFRDGSITIVDCTRSALNDTIYKEIQDLAEEEVRILGTEIADHAFDENLDIHCDRCNKFYRPYCRLHPLFKIPDRISKIEERQPGPVSFSQQTLPILFRIDTSKLPGAGLGVFAVTFVPVGMVFGPYKGIKVQKKTQFYKEGYAWRINNRDKKFYIDGSNPECSNWLRFINSPRHEEEQNMIAFQTNGKIFYRVIKPIRTDHELLVWYGASYGGEFVESEFGSKSKKPIKNPFIL